MYWVGRKAKKAGRSRDRAQSDRRRDLAHGFEQSLPAGHVLPEQFAVAHADLDRVIIADTDIQRREGHRNNVQMPNGQCGKAESQHQAHGQHAERGQRQFDRPEADQ